jgi:hypothetical protein
MTLRRRARALALVAAALIGIALLIAWFSLDTHLPGRTAVSYVPTILLLTAPLLFAALRLGRENDGAGPLAAGLTSLAIIAASLFSLISTFARMPAHDRGYFPLLLLGVFGGAFGAVTAIGLTALVVLFLLARSARRVWLTSTDRRFRLGIDGALSIVICLVAAMAVLARPPSPLSEAPNEHYSTTTVQHELLHIYTCLWRRAGAIAVNGFPATIDACAWPDAAPGSAAYGSNYALEYQPARRRRDGRAAGFSLVTVDTIHRNAESFYVDETGAVRRATGTRATATSPVWFSTGCTDLEAEIGSLEEYRRMHPTIGYPARIGAYSDTPDSPHNPVLHSRRTRPSDSIAVLGDSSTAIRYRTLRRTLIYRRLGERYTLSLFTTDSLPPVDETLMDEPRLELLRNFFRDSAGVAHATGEQRPATSGDRPLSLARCE